MGAGEERKGKVLAAAEDATREREGRPPREREGYVRIYMYIYTCI